MVDIRPFKGYSYTPSNISDLSSVIAPPYDVISERERADLASRSPVNFIHMTLPANYDPARSNPDFYKEAASPGRRTTLLHRRTCQPSGA